MPWRLSSISRRLSPCLPSRRAAFARSLLPLFTLSLHSYTSAASLAVRPCLSRHPEIYPSLIQICLSLCLSLSLRRIVVCLSFPPPESSSVYPIGAGCQTALARQQITVSAPVDARVIGISTASIFYLQLRISYTRFLEQPRFYALLASQV